MRPISTTQSALQAPLNHILGTEANVRVLRILALLGEPVGTSEIARRAGLQRSSVHRALRDLEASGIVSFLGVSQRANVGLRAENPLSQALRELFASERSRFDSLVDGLRRSAKQLKPLPISVWLEGPITTHQDKPGEPLVVGILAGSRDCESTVEALREITRSLAENVDVAIEFRGRTRADLDALEPARQHDLLNAIPIIGVPPLGLLEQFRGLWEVRNIFSHSDLDRRSIRYGEQIAKALTKDKSLIGAALDFLSLRLQNASEAEKKELREWQLLLRSKSTAAIRHVLTDPGERGTRLRQTNPFASVGHRLSDSFLTRQRFFARAPRQTSHPKTRRKRST